MSLFRDPEAPRPPTFSQALQRANAALPEHVRVAFKPYCGKGLRNPRPYRVMHNGQDVGGSASLEGALFAALQRRAGRFHA